MNAIGQIITVLAVTVFSNNFVNAIGQRTIFVDPGWHGTHCDASMNSSLHWTIEKADPSLIYIRVPFADDNSSSTEYDSLKTFAEDQIKAGKTCVITDTRPTDRCTGVGPILCRGDFGLLVQQHDDEQTLLEKNPTSRNSARRTTTDEDLAGSTM